MRVSVVGCGGVSKNHFEALKELESVEISSVVDIVPEKADAAAEKYDCKAFYDFETMLNEDKPDCIHICTPHYLHVPMAVKALTAGVHVLCEKPCAISAEGLSQLKMAQLLNDAKFGVCFQNRYNKSSLMVSIKLLGITILIKNSSALERDSRLKESLLGNKVKTPC